MSKLKDFYEGIRGHTQLDKFAMGVWTNAVSYPLLTGLSDGIHLLTDEAQISSALQQALINWISSLLDLDHSRLLLFFVCL